MAVHISKVFDTLRIRFLPLLLKVVKTIAYRIIPKIAMILFFIIPFLFNVLQLKIAYIVWIPSLIVFIIDSVLLYIKGKNKPEEFKPHDILMRGMSAVALYFFISAFITNYYDVNYSWWWISAITTAIAVPITLCNLWKYAEIKNAYMIEQKKTINEKQFNKIHFVLLVSRCVLHSNIFTLFIMPVYYRRFMYGNNIYKPFKPCYLKESCKQSCYASRFCCRNCHHHIFNLYYS